MGWDHPVGLLLWWGVRVVEVGPHKGARALRFAFWTIPLGAGTRERGKFSELQGAGGSERDVMLPW